MGYNSHLWKNKLQQTLHWAAKHQVLYFYLTPLWHSYTVIRRIHTQERLRFPLRLTSGNISLIAERDDSGHRTAHAWYQVLPLFWYARLEWWDRKYQDYLLERSHIRRDANNCAYSQIIARCIAICRAMLIAIISELFMSTLVKISRFWSRCKNQDLYPATSNSASVNATNKNPLWCDSFNPLWKKVLFGY